MAAKQKRAFKCQDGGHRLKESELITPIPRVEERVAPGESMPTGECPWCGAVAHLAEQGRMSDRRNFGATCTDGCREKGVSEIHTEKCVNRRREIAFETMREVLRLLAEDPLGAKQQVDAEMLDRVRAALALADKVSGGKGRR